MGGRQELESFPETDECAFIWSVGGLLLSRADRQLCDRGLKSAGQALCDPEFLAAPDAREGSDFAQEPQTGQSHPGVSHPRSQHVKPQLW